MKAELEHGRKRIELLAILRSEETSGQWKETVDKLIIWHDERLESIIDNSGCQCSEPIGYTTIKCCNHCGKSIEAFWNKSEKPNIFENHNHLDKPRYKCDCCKKPLLSSNPNICAKCFMEGGV